MTPDDWQNAATEILAEEYANNPELAEDNYTASKAAYDELLRNYLLSKLDSDEELDSDEREALMGFEDSDDSVLKAYAKYLKNYQYTYKPEATQIDNRINPDEEQIGIMAQDLEKVNPACVKETEDGVKVVDTAKLALMNAGAIADIARRLIAIDKELHHVSI